MALTTLPPDASHYDFYADLRASMTRRGATTAFPPAFLQRWEKLLTLTPLDLGIDLCPIRLAGAMSASQGDQLTKMRALLESYGG